MSHRLIFNQDVWSVCSKRLNFNIYLSNKSACIMNYKNKYYRGLFNDIKTNKYLAPVDYMSLMLNENNYIINPPKFITYSNKNKHVLDLLPWRNTTVDPNRVVIKIVDINKGMIRINYTNKFNHIYTSGDISCMKHTYNANYVNQMIVLRQLCDNGTFAEFIYKKDMNIYQMSLPIIDGLHYRITLECNLWQTNEYDDNYVI